MTLTLPIAMHKLTQAAAALLVAIGLLAGLAGLAHPAPAAAAGDCGGAATAADLDQAGQLLAKINTYRQQNGKAALSADGVLTQAAGWMARDMVTRKDGVGHTDSLGRGTGPRLVDCGYTGFAAVSYKENVCCTVSGNGSVKTPEQAFEAWRTSTKGHNEAMLDATMKFAGVGRSCDAQTCYWTLDLGTQGTNAPLPGANTPEGAASFESVNYPGLFIRHRLSLGELTGVVSDLDRADATFVVRPGLSGTPGAVSFESTNYPGHFLRHQNYRLKLHRNDDSDLFRKDASFQPRVGLADVGAKSFESVNFPGHFIRHQNYELSIARNDGSDLFRKDASFRQQPPPTGPVRSVPAGSASFESVNFPGYFIRHSFALGEITRLSSDLDRADATFVVRPALSGTPGAVSFESTNYPGYFLRHQDFRLKLSKNDGTDLFRQDASFQPRAGLADGMAKSFESVNYPGRFIRHRDYHLWVEQNDGSDLFRKDASFRQQPPR